MKTINLYTKNGRHAAVLTFQKNKNMYAVEFAEWLITDDRHLLVENVEEFVRSHNLLYESELTNARLMD